MGSLLDKLDKFKQKILDEKVGDPRLSSEITPEDQKNIIPGDQKIIDKNNVVGSEPTTLERIYEKPKFKNPLVRSERTTGENKIDQKLTEILNERILNLVKLGLKHELSMDNMIHYFKEVKKSKLYELRRYFSDSTSFEINKMLQYLHSTGVIKRDSNNWYYLK